MRLAFIIFVLVGLGVASVNWTSDADDGKVDLSISFDTNKLASPDFEQLGTHTKESIQGVYNWIDENDPNKD